MLSALISLQAIIIAAVLAGIKFTRVKSRNDSLLKICSGALVILGFGLSGIWVYPPFIGFILLCLIFAFLSIRRLRKQPMTDTVKTSKRAHAATFISTALGSLLIWQGVSGRQAPKGEYINLSSPLNEDAKNCVLSGGASTGVNLHYIVGANGALTEEVHSIDFIKLNAGFRTAPNRLWHPKPLSPKHYAIYGTPIFAPCAGTVISADDGKADVLAGFRFRDGTGSNQVTLQCGATNVMLAHMKKGSVAVAAGDAVKAGAQIGLVGNTGNSEEPHLHIHAFKRDADGKTSPVPMRFNERFLARGDCL